MADLSEYYGAQHTVRAGVCTLGGRLQIVSDILFLRRQRIISIRLSLDRESDRFTTTLERAWARCLPLSSELPRSVVMKSLFLNCYFARTALSEMGNCYFARTALSEMGSRCSSGLLFPEKNVSARMAAKGVVLRWRAKVEKLEREYDKKMGQNTPPVGG